MSPCALYFPTGTHWRGDGAATLGAGEEGEIPGSFWPIAAC